MEIDTHDNYNVINLITGVIVYRFRTYYEASAWIKAYAVSQPYKERNYRIVADE